MSGNPIPLDIRERVARGAALLDQAEPGWAERVNLDTLKLYNCEHCVSGQLFGSYSVGIHQLGLNSIVAVTYGFDAHPISMRPCEIERVRHDQEYDNLTAAWKEAIQARI